MGKKMSLRYLWLYLNNRRVNVCKNLVCEVTSVFEAATQKTDIGTEAKTEGLITGPRFFDL